MDKVKLNRNVFDKRAFEKTIDTSFSELISQPDPVFFDVNLATIDDFFTLYNKYFYEIPKNGSVNSHEYLIKTSSEYINFNETNQNIQALLEEITALRQEILDIQIASIEEKAISNNDLPSFSKELEGVLSNARQTNELSNTRKK